MELTEVQICTTAPLGLCLYLNTPGEGANGLTGGPSEQKSKQLCFCQKTYLILVSRLTERTGDRNTVLK